MSRVPATIVLALGVCLAAFVAGCASPGEPTARHPIVPAPVADLAAGQVGGDVVLTFTLPNQSMDKEALAARPSIEVYRAILAPGAVADRKSMWNLAYTVPPERVEAYLKNNHVEFHDPLAAAILAGAPGSRLAYMVRTRAVRARASDDSNILALRIYAPPAAPGDVGISVTESSINVTWSETGPPAGASSAGYRVYRGQTESPQEGTAQDASQAKLKNAPEFVGSVDSAKFQDSHFEFGQTYLYTVRSVAAYGANLVESADSASATVAARDVFPPAAPVGLEAAVVPATTQGPAYVELSWGISPEPDLAGYRIYRGDSQDISGNPLNTDLLPSPAFRDISVVRGGRYFYRVSAVDRSGNESPMSSAVPAEIP